MIYPNLKDIVSDCIDALLIQTGTFNVGKDQANDFC
jgi:hypothetical protein